MKNFRKFVGIVRKLRAECPWDRAQSHRSIRHSLIEEAYEVVEALDEGNTDELRKELGDLLLHVVMHSTMAEQAKEFTLNDVISGIISKLVYRHPHVFGKTEAKSQREVRHRWEALKLSEGRSSALDGIPNGLPALQHAFRAQERAASAGFEWEAKDDVWKKLHEEVRELQYEMSRRKGGRLEEEFGDFLFALVNVARFEGIHPENALRSAIRKFTKRFRFVERELRKQGRTTGTSNLKEMEALWRGAKKRGI
jgi:MazG family protein